MRLQAGCLSASTELARLLRRLGRCLGEVRVQAWRSASRPELARLLGGLRARLGEMRLQAGRAAGITKLTGLLAGIAGCLGHCLILSWSVIALNGPVLKRRVDEVPTLADENKKRVFYGQKVKKNHFFRNFFGFSKNGHL